MGEGLELAEAGSVPGSKGGVGPGARQNAREKTGLGGKFYCDQAGPLPGSLEGGEIHMGR